MKKLVLKFIKLASYKATISIFSGSLLSGFLQVLAIFAIFPLMELLGTTPISNDNSFYLIAYKEIFSLLSLELNLKNVLIFMFFVVLLSALINYSISLYSAIISAKIVRKLRERVIKSSVYTEWRYLAAKKPGDIVHSVIVEAGKTASGYQDTVAFLASIAQALVVVISAYFISEYVFFASIIVSFLVLSIFKKWIDLARVVGQKMADSLKKVTNKVADGLGGIKAIKAMGSENFIIKLLYIEIEKLEKNQIDLFKISSIPNFFREPVAVFFLVILFYFVITNELSPIESIIPMGMLLLKVVQFFSTAQSSFQSIKKMEPYYNSLLNHLEEADLNLESRNGTNLLVFKKNIQIDNAVFFHENKKILNNASLTITKGDFLVISGKSGVGKTTLIDILCSFYKLDSGSILIDGVNLEKINLSSWRAAIGYVPQDLFLFNDSIFNNITMGDKRFSKADVQKSLISAGAWTFVEKLPLKMDMLVGNFGFKLSGGQRQRISIARAIVRNSKILLLDEPTTALDSETAEELLLTLKNLSDNGMTIVVISHQESVIKKASKVCFLLKEKFEIVC
jgi:ATP-binding cassette, subfamily C, bacterial